MKGDPGCTVGGTMKGDPGCTVGGRMKGEPGLYCRWGNEGGLWAVP